MRTRRWFAITVALLIIATAVVRFQRPHSATLFRHDRDLVARSSVVFIRPLRGGTVCRAATDEDDFIFSAPFRTRTATGDEIELQLRILYVPPKVLPADWPSGDWCSSLNARLSGAVSAWSSRVTSDALIADRREAAHGAAEAVQRELARSGIRVDDAKARIDLPSGFERLRAIPEVASQARPTGPVIFIGLDGADWELLDAYMASESMPNLQRLVHEGSGGTLMTEQPPLSPLLWSTMFTGVGPLEHEILDFTRFNPSTHEREPITSDERRRPAIWNMLTYAGKSTAVFGVWATYAAEPVHGLMVSDRLFTFLYSESVVPPAAVFPPFRTDWARAQLASAEEAVNAARLRQYLPWISDEEYSRAASAANPYSAPASALRRILVETEVYRRLSHGYLRGNHVPDLTIVYIQGTDTIGHVFAPFTPPKLPEISDDDYRRYGAVSERYFREIDSLLADYAKIAQSAGGVLVIASDHGFRWQEGRPTQLSSFAAASAAKWHRDEGMYLMWGAGIPSAPGHPLRGGIRQICTTLAALSGLPLPSGSEPTPLPGSPKQSTAIDYRRYFQRPAPPPQPTNSRTSEEEIAKLRALGYIGSNEVTRSRAGGSADTKTAGAYNNAGLILRHEKKTAEAISSFERAIAVDPNLASALWNLSETLFDGRQQIDRADELLVKALANGLLEGAKQVVARSIHYQRSGRVDRSLRLLDRAIEVRGNGSELRIFRGRYRLDRDDCRGALGDFQVAVHERPDAIAYASLGLAQLCLGDEQAARVAFGRSLQLDPDQPMLRRALGR